jgi:predicted TIM-barrel fold metal-dependent hydrolase
VKQTPIRPSSVIRPGSALAAEFWEHGRSASCPVINIHAHPGPVYSGYMPNCHPADMVRELRKVGGRLMCVAPHSALFAPEIGNAEAESIVQEFPQEIRAYMTINPQYPELMRRDLAGFDKKRHIYVGFKLLPDYHRVKLSDRRYQTVFEFAEERGLPVISHTYANSPYNGEAEVEKVVARHSGLKFIMAHCLKANWRAAAAIARQYPHAYLDLTAVMGQWGAVDYLCTHAGSEKMLFGTDSPWYSLHQAIGQLLSADIGDEDIHNILHRNAERLLNPTGLEG